jgi:hypothetical protein
MLRGTALGLIPACHIEPLNALINRILDVTEGVEAYFDRDDEWKMKYKLCESTPETFLSLHNRYCWSKGLQSVFQSRLNECGIGDILVTNSTNLLCDRDSSAMQQFFSTN